MKICDKPIIHQVNWQVTKFIICFMLSLGFSNSVFAQDLVLGGPLPDQCPVELRRLLI